MVVVRKNVNVGIDGAELFFVARLFCFVLLFFFLPKEGDARASTSSYFDVG